MTNIYYDVCGKYHNPNKIHNPTISELKKEDTPKVMNMLVYILSEMKGLK